MYTFSSVKQIDQQQHWETQELKELISNLKITKNSLSDYEVDKELQVSGKIYQKDSTCKLREKDIEKDLKEMFRELVPDQPLLFPIIDRVFKQVSCAVRLKDVESNDIKNLESIFNKLPSYCANLEETDDLEKALEQVAGKVTEVARDIIQQGLSPIYLYWKKELNLGEREVCTHGYVTGVLGNLFKYRYALDIAVEQNLGRGRADLMVVSRLDGLTNKNWNGIPLCFEFKGSTNVAEKGLEQISKQGYLHITPRMRTLVRKGAALGVNMLSKTSVVSQVMDIKVF